MIEQAAAIPRRGSTAVVRCRHCHSAQGKVVLDLGRQPGCEQFPESGDPAGDERAPLRMWFCSACALAQLAEDPGWPENVLGVEPAAMRTQGEWVADRLLAEAWVRRGATVAEFGSPHGGSRIPSYANRGLVPTESGKVDLLLDTYGLLHEPDQQRALALRASRLAPGGTMVLQFHPLSTVLTHRQWGELRHGHHAYWSGPALDAALSAHGLGVHRYWRYRLAGGTAVVLATATPEPDGETRRALAEERAAGVLDVTAVGRLQHDAEVEADALRAWLLEQRSSGRVVFGYGAASKAVPVLNHAGVHSGLLAGVADASPGKQGRRVPGTDVPVVSPADLVAGRPDLVLLFVPDLLDEVRRAVPQIAQRGARWLTLPEVLGGTGAGS